MFIKEAVVAYLGHVHKDKNQQLVVHTAEYYKQLFKSAGFEIVGEQLQNYD